MIDWTQIFDEKIEFLCSLLQRPESLQTNTSVNTWRHRWFWTTTSMSYWSGSCVRLGTSKADSSCPAPPKAFPRTETRWPGSPTFSSTKSWTLATRKFPAQTSLMFELIKGELFSFILCGLPRSTKTKWLCSRIRKSKDSSCDGHVWFGAVRGFYFRDPPQITDRAKDEWCYRPMMCLSIR